MTSIAIINTHAPYGTANGQEALDLVLAAGSFGQRVGLFFIDDGVFQLVANQQPDSIEHKNYSKTFGALTFYDIEEIYVCADSMAERGLNTSRLHFTDIEVLSSERWQVKLAEYEQVLRF